MKVSIITVCFNSSEFINDAIRSVLVQDYPEIEYIIVDGGSSDGTLEIIRSFSEAFNGHMRFISEKDSGIYDAMNKGIALSTGDVVGFLNADDILDSSSIISDYVRTFMETSAEAVFADLDYVNRSDISKTVRVWQSGPLPRSRMSFGWHPAHPTFYVRRYIFDKYGLFDLDFKIAADYELMLRFVHKFRIGVAYLPLKTVRMRVGGVSNSSLKNIIRANWECVKAWDRNNLHVNPLTVPGKLIWKLKQVF
jgi:glycosyltransferase involved in cell wall biosynthesis